MEPSCAAAGVAEAFLSGGPLWHWLGNSADREPSIRGRTHLMSTTTKAAAPNAAPPETTTDATNPYALAMPAMRLLPLDDYVRLVEGSLFQPGDTFHAVPDAGLIRRTLTAGNGRRGTDRDIPIPPGLRAFYFRLETEYDSDNVWLIGTEAAIAELKRLAQLNYDVMACAESIVMGLWHDARYRHGLTIAADHDDSRDHVRLATALTRDAIDAVPRLPRIDTATTETD